MMGVKTKIKTALAEIGFVPMGCCANSGAVRRQTGFATPLGPHVECMASEILKSLLRDCGRPIKVLLPVIEIQRQVRRTL